MSYNLSFYRVGERVFRNCSPYCFDDSVLRQGAGAARTDASTEEARAVPLAHPKNKTDRDHLFCCRCRALTTHDDRRCYAQYIYCRANFYGSITTRTPSGNLYECIALYTHVPQRLPHRTSPPLCRLSPERCTAKSCSLSGGSKDKERKRRTRRKKQKNKQTIFFTRRVKNRYRPTAPVMVSAAGGLAPPSQLTAVPRFKSRCCTR